MNDFEKIYNDYFKLVYKYLLFLTNNADISEDLAQETFYKAITKIHTFKNKSKISTWLCQIAKNLLLNLLFQQCGKYLQYDQRYSFDLFVKITIFKSFPL